MEAQGLAGTPDYGSRQRPHTIAATYYPGVYYMSDEIDFYGGHLGLERATGSGGNPFQQPRTHRNLRAETD